MVLGGQEAPDSGEEGREWLEKAQGLLGSGNVVFLDVVVVTHMRSPKPEFRTYFLTMY